MNTFFERLRAACQKSVRYQGNMSQLSIDAGLSRKYLSNIYSKRDDSIKSPGPGIFNIAHVADLLEVSLDWLVGRDQTVWAAIEKTRGEAAENILRTMLQSAIDQTPSPDLPPSTNHLAKLYLSSGGRIEAFADSLKFMDIYEPVTPNNQTVKVREVGSQSLAAKTMGVASADVLQKSIEGSDDNSLMRNTHRDHLFALEHGMYTKPAFLNHAMPNRPVMVRIEYTKTLICVCDANGKRSTLLFASLITR